MLRRATLALLLGLLAGLAYADTLVVPGVVANDTGACATHMLFSRLSIAADGTLTKTCVQPIDADISFSDITTGNVSTTAHGYAPKAPNDATKYLDGTGAYSVPASSGANTALSNLASVSVNTALLAQSGVDLGSTTKPFRDLYILGSGTFGTGFVKFTDTALTTGTATVNFPFGSGSGTFTPSFINLAETFSAAKTFTVTGGYNTDVGLLIGSTNAMGELAALTGLTPDGPAIFTGTTSNSWRMFEVGDASFDFQNGPCGTSACTDPTLEVFSHNQNTSQYVSLRHDGTNAVVDVGTGALSLNENQILLKAVVFASLGTPSNGTISYCSDCTIANPCAGSGTGALAKRLNGVWVCN